MPDLLDAAIAKYQYPINSIYTTTALHLTDVIKNNPGKHSSLPHIYCSLEMNLINHFLQHELLKIVTEKEYSQGAFITNEASLIPMLVQFFYDFYGKTFLAGMKISIDLSTVFTAVVKNYNELVGNLLRFFLQDHTKQISAVFSNYIQESNNAKQNEEKYADETGRDSFTANSPEYSEYISFNPNYERLKKNSVTLANSAKPTQLSVDVRSKSVESIRKDAKELNAEIKSSIKSNSSSQIASHRAVQPLLKLTKISNIGISKEPNESKASLETERSTQRKYVRKTEKLRANSNATSKQDTQRSLKRGDSNANYYSSNHNNANLTTRTTQHTEIREYNSERQRLQQNLAGVEKQPVANFHLNLNKMEGANARGKSQSNIPTARGYSANLQDYDSNSTGNRVLLVNPLIFISCLIMQIRIVRRLVNPTNFRMLMKKTMFRTFLT